MNSIECEHAQSRLCCESPPVFHSHNNANPTLTRRFNPYSLSLTTLPFSHPSVDPGSDGVGENEIVEERGQQISALLKFFMSSNIGNFNLYSPLGGNNDGDEGENFGVGK